MPRDQLDQLRKLADLSLGRRLFTFALDLLLTFPQLPRVALDSN